MRKKLGEIVANIIGYTWFAIIMLGSASILLLTIKLFLDIVGVI